MLDKQKKKQKKINELYSRVKMKLNDVRIKILKYISSNH